MSAGALGGGGGGAVQGPEERNKSSEVGLAFLLMYEAP